MNKRSILAVVALLVGLCLVPVAVAQRSTTRKPAKQHAPSHTAQTPSATNEEITLDIHGAGNNDVAKMITRLLADHGIHATVRSNAAENERCVVKITSTTDLGACGHALSTMSMTPKTKTPPCLDLVLFGKLDASSRQKALDALSKLKGVSADSSQFLSDQGEIEVRIVGGSKVTANEIRSALQTAGLNVSFVRSSRTARAPS